jgi:hypothetical protein
MAVGKSGKVVLEIDPDFKRELRSALDRDGLTMKEWFLHSAKRYLATRTQTVLVFSPGPAQAAGEQEPQ